MKHWQSQLFPLILLSIIAGLTFWLQKSVEMEEPRRDGKLRHDPDAFAENFEVRRFDQTGQVKYRLTAPKMTHFPDDDTSLLTDPKLIAYRPDAPPLTLIGKNAKVTSKGETVYLWEDVSVTRSATPERAALIARMPDLTIQPNRGFAFTNSPVEMTQGESWVKGVGAELDNNAATFILQSRVTGLYIRPKTTP